MGSLKRIEYQPLKILAIDPGTMTMGISLLTIDDDKMKLHVNYCRTHNASQFTHISPRLAMRVDELTLRLHVHSLNLSHLIEWLNPDLIVAESPFFNPRRPTSSEPLARMKQVLVEVAIQHDLPIEWIAPQAMKKAIGAKMGKGTNTKVEIEKAINALIEQKQVVLDEGLKLTDIDEHSIDSIGVGYAYATRLFLNSGE